jgi:adenosylhomocysteine nucleosidase
MKALICVALAGELGDFKDAPVLVTGVGKINATLALMNHAYHYLLPYDVIINVGSAGGVNLPKHTVHEFGIFREGDLSYPDYKPEIITNWRSNKVMSTFDSFQTTKPKHVTHGVDMEAFALAKVCKLHDKKFYCFKYITDVIGEPNQEETWAAAYTSGQEALRAKLKEIL